VSPSTTRARLYTKRLGREERSSTHLLAARYDLGYHRLLRWSATLPLTTPFQWQRDDPRNRTHRDRIPRTDKYPVKGLVRPELPRVVEPEAGLGDPDTAPCAEHEDPERVLLRALSAGTGPSGRDTGYGIRGTGHGVRVATRNARREASTSYGW
jgi:hypothetical protein